MNYLQKILDYKKQNPKSTDKALIEAIKIPRATYYRYKKAKFKDIKIKHEITKPQEIVYVNNIKLQHLDEQEKLNYIEALYSEALDLARKKGDAKEIRETTKALVSLYGLSPLTKQRLTLQQINIQQMENIQKADEVLAPELTLLDKPLEHIKRHKEAKDNDD